MTHCVGVKLHTHRVLHPCIGNQNPYSRNSSTNTSKPSCRQVETLANLLPTEEHHSEECRLHKESEYTLYSQWRTENISHKPRVVAPVCTKLKFENNTCGDSYGEVYSKNFHPEFCNSLPKLVTRFHINSLHCGHNNRKSER